MESLNIIFTGKDEVAVQRELVPPLQPGQLLVQTQRSLISSGTEGIVLGQKYEPDTHWHEWVKFPTYSGYSNIGRIVEVGADVTDWQPGDRVATRSAHRECFAVEADDAMPVPDAIPDDEATWFALAGIVQNGVRSAAHSLGDTAVIIGMGPLGQLATQYVRLCGARNIIAVDPISARVEMARTNGATHGIATGVESAREVVTEVTEGRMADVVYDVTGHPVVLPQALKLARKLGKVVLLGDTGYPSQQRLTHDVVTRGLCIIGAHDSNPPATASDHAFWSHRNMIELFFHYLECGKMRVADLITHRFQPVDAPAAYRLLQNERSVTMGVLFEWTNS